MKKYLFILSFILTSCGCVLGQIPPQYLYVGDNCQATLPDYTSRVTATDNCVLASLIQTPTAGTILTSAMMINNVVIKATDNSGNSSQINFNVILIDTVPPLITVDSVLITGDWEILNTLYDQADRIIADKLEIFDAVFPYSSLGLPVQDSSYFKEYMIVSTSPGYAITGQGGRIWSFFNPLDTL